MDHDGAVYTSFTPPFVKFSKTGPTSAEWIDQWDLFQARRTKENFSLGKEGLATEAEGRIKQMQDFSTEAHNGVFPGFLEW